MNRSNKYYPLQWVVEVMPKGQHFFEVMAAFNVDIVAKDYCDRCHEHNPQNMYRVMERHGYKYVRIYGYLKP